MEAIAVRNLVSAYLEVLRISGRNAQKLAVLKVFRLIMSRFDRDAEAAKGPEDITQIYAGYSFIWSTFLAALSRRDVEPMPPFLEELVEEYRPELYKNICAWMPESTMFP